MRGPLRRVSVGEALRGLGGAGAAGGHGGQDALGRRIGHAGAQQAEAERVEGGGAFL